jgi:hypothetical protein
VRSHNNSAGLVIGDTYLYEVVAIYSDPDDVAEAASIEVKIPLVHPARSIEATYEGNEKIKITWEAPEAGSTINLVGFRIARNGMSLQAANVVLPTTTTSFIDENFHVSLFPDGFPYGALLRYHVTAVYENPNTNADTSYAAITVPQP